MGKHHLIHLVVGCLLAGVLFVALLALGAGLQWATAAFIVGMVICHLFGFFYLKTKGDEPEEKGD